MLHPFRDEIPLQFWGPQSEIGLDGQNGEWGIFHPSRGSGRCCGLNACILLISSVEIYTHDDVLGCEEPLRREEWVPLMGFMLLSVEIFFIHW